MDNYLPYLVPEPSMETPAIPVVLTQYFSIDCVRMPNVMDSDRGNSFPKQLLVEISLSISSQHFHFGCIGMRYEQIITISIFFLYGLCTLWQQFFHTPFSDCEQRHAKCDGWSVSKSYVGD